MLHRRSPRNETPPSQDQSSWIWGQDASESVGLWHFPEPRLASAMLASIFPHEKSIPPSAAPKRLGKLQEHSKADPANPTPQAPSREEGTQRTIPHVIQL